MKKLSVLLIIISVFIISGCGKKKQEVNVRAGMINFMVGEVYLVSKEKHPVPAKLGDAVIKGMKIITYDKATVEVYFGENVIKILGNSSVEVMELIGDDKSGEKTDLFVENGKVFTKISKKLMKGDDFNIKTPTATAGVRGTDFMVNENEGKSNIACLDGKVVVSNAATPAVKSVELNAGQEVTVEPGKPMTVKELSLNNKKMIEDIKKDIKNIQDDIRKQFEKQREEIRQYVIDQKEKNRQMIEDQKALDKKNIDDQKAGDRANIDAIKGSSDAEKVRSSEAVNRQKDDQKNLMDGVKPDINKQSVKPEIKKYSSEIK
jgi:hypothetical protein